VLPLTCIESQAVVRQMGHGEPEDLRGCTSGSCIVAAMACTGRHASLPQRFYTISIENLNFTGILRNRRPARSFANTAIPGFQRRREYIHFRTVIVIDCWYPSSKTYSGCRHVPDMSRIVPRGLNGPTHGRQRPQRQRDRQRGASGP